MDQCLVDFERVVMEAGGINPASDLFNGEQLGNKVRNSPIHIDIDVKKQRTIAVSEQILADGVGFEPTRRSHACRFSRPVPSTARPPIQKITG